jgi:hypothetical protein
LWRRPVANLLGVADNVLTVHLMRRHGRFTGRVLPKTVASTSARRSHRNVPAHAGCRGSPLPKTNAFSQKRF